MNYRTVAKRLLQEHPQTVAVALARLPVEQSGEIIKLLPAFLQAELLKRIVQIDQLPDEVIEEIDALLGEIM